MADKPEGKPRRPENEYKKPRSFVDDPPMEIVVPESKSWDEHEACCRIAIGKAKEIQAKTESLIKDWAEFEGMTLRAYKKMPANDAMFSDSPLSPMRMQTAFRQHLAKFGWKWAAGLPWGPDSVRPFLAVVTEACTWGTRILKDKERAEKVAKAELAAKKAQDAVGAVV